MYKRFVDLRSIVSLYTPLCNYLKLFYNGPGGPKHVGNLLKSIRGFLTKYGVPCWFY